MAPDETPDKAAIARFVALSRRYGVVCRGTRALMPALLPELYPGPDRGETPTAAHDIVGA